MSSKYYGYECGVLLTKEDSEFEFYSCNNRSLPYGFYDEDQGFCSPEGLENMRATICRFVENGVDKTYGIISFQGVCSDSELNDIIKSEDVSSLMSYSFFKNKNEIQYSVCKINGKIIEGFLENEIEAALKKSSNKLSLSEQIHFASNRANKTNFTTKPPVKEATPER